FDERFLILGHYGVLSVASSRALKVFKASRTLSFQSPLRGLTRTTPSRSEGSLTAGSHTMQTLSGLNRAENQPSSNRTLQRASIALSVVFMLSGVARTSAKSTPSRLA